MKLKLLCALILLSGLDAYSQTEKTVKGKILFEDSALPNVEVINSNSKKMTVSDVDGNFSIAVHKNDLLVFVTKTYELKKVIVDPMTFEKGQITISLAKKPEELAEVTITNIPSVKLSKDKKWEQGKLDQYALEKAANTPKIVGVYNGTIENGADFMRIGGMILGLLIKEKEKKKEILPEIKFTALAKTMVDQQYYLENLKLKQDEINLFLQFCEADPKSYQVVKDNNILSMMDFLTIKNQEFKKL